MVSFSPAVALSLTRYPSHTRALLTPSHSLSLTVSLSLALSLTRPPPSHTMAALSLTELYVLSHTLPFSHSFTSLSHPLSHSPVTRYGSFELPLSHSSLASVLFHSLSLLLVVSPSLLTSSLSLTPSLSDSLYPSLVMALCLSLFPSLSESRCLSQSFSLLLQSTQLIVALSPPPQSLSLSISLPCS